MDTNCFHFTVEAVTSDGPRSAVDVVRAALRILDYKLSQFMDARLHKGFGESPGDMKWEYMAPTIGDLPKGVIKHGLLENWTTERNR